MTLWALMFLPSQVSVTSTKSSEHFSESNALTMFVWKLFQRKQNWSAITTYSAEIPAKINFLLNPTFDSKLTNAQIHVQTNEFNTPSELYTLQSHKSLDFLSIITVITIYLIKCIKMQCMTSIDTFFHFCSVSVCVCQSVSDTKFYKIVYSFTSIAVFVYGYKASYTCVQRKNR